MSLARSLLQAWRDPLADLSNSANSLLHPSQSSISNKIRELQEHSKSLGDGLDILSGKVSKCGETNHQSNNLICFCADSKCYYKICFKNSFSSIPFRAHFTCLLFVPDGSSSSDHLLTALQSV